MNITYQEKITGVKKTIDLLCNQHDNAMTNRDWELAINISYLIEQELEKLDDNVISINFT